MANVFKDTLTIVQEMCDDYKALTGITLSPTQLDDSNVIKFYADAGAISSLYSEVQRTANDIFAFSASEEALRNHLRARGLPGQIQPQKSHGQIQFTLTGAATIPIGTQVKRASDGAVYQTIQSGTGTGAGTLTLFVESLDEGNDENLDQLNQPFNMITSIANVNPACESVSLFLDGRDLETKEEMAARVIEHDRDDNSGGNAVAYETWAKEASNEVVTAKCLRLVRGPDTVDLIITSGTTDISAAVEAGQPVSRLPSSALVTQVQTYVNQFNPVTDDLLVRAPTETDFDVTFKYSLYNETVANRSFVDSEITKVIKTYIYSAKPLDILYPTTLERLIDQRVGSQIKERACDNFDGVNSFYIVPDDQILKPNDITLGTYP